MNEPHTVPHMPARRTDGVLWYARIRRPIPWKPILLGGAALPWLYVLVYVVLRVSGVFHLFYNQGGWEIDGSTGIVAIDVTFLPAMIVEADCQSRLLWLPEPTGG